LADPNLPNNVEWLVEGLVPRGGLTVVYGIGKGGKTTLLSHLAAAIVGGQEFLSRSVKEGPVLWLDLEQHVTLTRRKLDEAGAAGRPNPLHIYNGPAPRPEDVAGELTRRSAVAVVIDSLSKFLCLKDENDAAEVTARLGPLAGC
jgi:RecA-family ATPase